MASATIWILSVFLILQLYFLSASAVVNCGRTMCYDRSYGTAYCCTPSLFSNCCYRYTRSVWSLWYFWFGIGVFFLLVAGCIAGFRRHKMNSRLRQTVHHHPVQVATVTTTATTVQQQNPNFPMQSDLPPSYEQLQNAGIASQYQQFSKDGAPPLYTQPQGYAYPNPTHHAQAIPPYQQPTQPPVAPYPTS